MLQDSLADWAAALLFDKASAASAATQKKPSRKAAAAAAADTEDMEWQGEGTEAQHAEAAAGNLDPAAAADDATFAELRQLLSAVASVGRAAAACLGKLCASMAAKKKLKAVAVARGLEAVIAREPAVQLVQCVECQPDTVGCWCGVLSCAGCAGLCCVFPPSQYRASLSERPSFTLLSTVCTCGCCCTILLWVRAD